ncbi:hypothetical protein [Kribbella kalugense]|uniref:hypothetical protein n=1 Tax=Kribbella kalugense TaxID=2512221 RepID=UPI001EDD8334|nr:hypothetical protein [Kribbella kalugense]
MFEIDARHNGPVGTRAVSAQYVVDGLPLWVDWHIHPVSRATWPADSTVVFDRQGISQASAALSEYRGEYEPATPKTLDEQDAMRLALVPIAGKQLARRSPETPRTIEFLGGTPETDWPDHLAALRELLNEFTNLDSLAAARAYLDLVEGTLG